MSQQKSHTECTNTLSAYLLTFSQFGVPNAFPLAVQTQHDTNLLAPAP